MIFASEDRLVVAHYMDLVVLTPLAVLFYGTTILLTALVNSKLLRLEYGQHQSVVFTAVSKNVSLTIAVLVSVFDRQGRFMAVIQPSWHIYRPRS